MLTKTPEVTHLVNGRAMTFAQYRAAVSVEIAGRLGVSLDDLADVDLWGDWEAGTDPKDAARDAVENDADGMLDDEFLDDLFEEF